jgi:hypothetical protein
LDNLDKRFDRYVQVFYKLHRQQKQEQRKWSSEACKRGDLGELVQKIANLDIDDPENEILSKKKPISYGQNDFFKAFSVFVEKDLREIAVNRSCRRNCPPDSKWYNTQLIERIDTYLSSLDEIILLKEEADDAHAKMFEEDDQGKGEAYETQEKYIREEIDQVELKMNNEFLQIILFVFAVPQEVPLPARYRKFYGVRLSPPLESAEVNVHVKWMHDDCLWYQRNTKFMEFLADCAVIALMCSYYDYSESFIEICQSYTDIVPDYEKTHAFSEVVGQKKEIHDDSLRDITGRVQRDAHRRRSSRYAKDPAFDAPQPTGAASTRANLAALNDIYVH